MTDQEREGARKLSIYIIVNLEGPLNPRTF